MPIINLVYEKPSYSWEPNANTYCYCPLETDYADHSWNNVAVTSDLTSYWTDMFPWGTGKYVCVPQTNIVTVGTDWTILFWIYPRNKNNGKVTVVAETTTWNSYNFNRWFNWEFWAGASWLPSGLNCSNQAWGSYEAWHLFAATHAANGNIYGSWDGVPFTTNGSTYWNSITNYPIWFGRHVVYTSSSYPYGLLGQMKDIIVETKVRTDEEIAKYYNRSKSKYWL